MYVICLFMGFPRLQIEVQKKIPFFVQNLIKILLTSLLRANTFVNVHAHIWELDCQTYFLQRYKTFPLSQTNPLFTFYNFGDFLIKYLFLWFAIKIFLQGWTICTKNSVQNSIPFSELSFQRGFCPLTPLRSHIQAQKLDNSLQKEGKL